MPVLFYLYVGNCGRRKKAAGIKITAPIDEGEFETIQPGQKNEFYLFYPG